MTPVEVRYEAELDLDAAAGFYDAQQTGLGDRFRAAVARALGQIAAQPGIGSRTGHRGVRQWPLSGFPFSLIYVVRNGVADVLAAPHHKQRSSVWRRRLP